MRARTARLFHQRFALVGGCTERPPAHVSPLQVLLLYLDDVGVGVAVHALGLPISPRISKGHPSSFHVVDIRGIN